MDFYNPLDPKVLANPYPSYQKLQEKAGLHWNEIYQAWMAVHYTDVLAIYQHSGFIAAPRVNSFFSSLTDEEKNQFTWMKEAFSRWTLFTDPPRHRRIRTFINQSFLPRIVEALRPKVVATARLLLREADKKGEFDIIADLAYPLPVLIIGQLLGVPLADHLLLKKWSGEIAGFFAAAVRTFSLATTSQIAMMEMTEYFETLMRKRRTSPENDFISRILFESVGTEPLTKEESLATCVMLLFAGHETTTNLIGNGVLALMTNPEQLAKLKASVNLINPVVEECLRFDGPVQVSSRVADQTIYAAGLELKKGERVMLLIGAANRDPAQFTNPQKFELHRSNNYHLAFGHKTHFCPGAKLARIETAVALIELFTKFPNLKLISEPLTWKKDVSLRGLSNLSVSAE